MTLHHQCLLSTALETQAFGTKLAPFLQRGDVLLLQGQLGAGKTTFTQGVIQSLTTNETVVTSPTFSLIQTYPTTAGELWHIDLYRLTPSEIPSLALEENWETGISLIEWPEHLPAPPPTPLTLSFSVNSTTEVRSLTLTGSLAWLQRLQPLL